MAPQFTYSDLLPLGEDSTQYRLLTKEGVSVKKHGDLEFLHIEASALSHLSEFAIHDISHYLRAAHVQQLTNILSDPEASPPQFGGRFGQSFSALRTAVRHRARPGRAP